MQSKVKKINFNGQDIYVGIDVHLKNWVVTIMLNNIIYKTFSMDPEAKKLSNYLKKAFPNANYYSVYEAGFCGYSVHRDLITNGIKNIIVNPADVPTTDKDKQQKEDRRDSRKLAKSLSNGELEGIHILGEEMEGLRSLVRYRSKVISEIVKYKNRIKSILKQYGIKSPKELDKGSKYWSVKYINWLKTIKTFTPEGTFVLEETIETLEQHQKQRLKINKELSRLSTEPKYRIEINLLRSVPGIGMITAFVILSEIETITRFKNLDKLCSYVGLIPTTNSSGEKERLGKITRRSNKLLRKCIIESAWVAIRQDPALLLKYAELKKRMKPNMAIIRIAKKLLNRIRYVLKNEQEYEKSIA